MNSLATVLLFPLLLGAWAAGCIAPTDGEGDGVWITIRPEEFPPTSWIVWNQTAPGEARILVGQAIDLWRANGSMTPLTEDQATLVREYLRTEWTRAGGNGTTNSYPIEHTGRRLLIGIDRY